MKLYNVIELLDNNQKFKILHEGLWKGYNGVAFSGKKEDLKSLIQDANDIKHNPESKSIIEKIINENINKYNTETDGEFIVFKSVNFNDE